ncbi:MAG: regulatory protein RecX [Thermoanaerobaculia bacterium]
MSRELSESERCYAAAVRLLEYRFRARVELRRKLEDRDFDARAIEETLARLDDEGWLDDVRFARELARSRARKGVGPKRISLALRGFGVDDEAARAGMAEAAEEEPPEERLREAVRKRMRILARRHGEEWLREPEGRKKLLAYLLHQGYEYAAVTAALDSELRK